ncbi:hypothetical protein, partial [Methylocystis parvus]|uniref:hypothetical protein n=1 Tax=Methylocystis parvus TaxID=134 RepID=UPI001AEC2FDA
QQLYRAIEVDGFIVVGEFCGLIAAPSPKRVQKPDWRTRRQDFPQVGEGLHLRRYPYPGHRGNDGLNGDDRPYCDSHLSVGGLKPGKQGHK